MLERHVESLRGRRLHDHFVSLPEFAEISPGAERR